VLCALIAGAVLGTFTIAQHRAGKTAPSEATLRLLQERKDQGAVAYLLLVSADHVREALPQSDPREENALAWSATLPGGTASQPADTVVVDDRGEVTMLWLADPWDLAAATERPPRLARFDTWLRARFPLHHIISGDAAVLSEGLASRRDPRSLSPRDAAKLLPWFDRQPHERWRVIN